MAKYRKKPVVIEAMQFNGTNIDEIRESMGLRPLEFYGIVPKGAPDFEQLARLYVAANSAFLVIEPGEWVLPDALGCYPCKPAIFEATYEAVEETRP